MSEGDEEKWRIGIPKYYYWGKKPPTPQSLQKNAAYRGLIQTHFVNNAQKKFYAVQLAFTAAKVVAIALVFYVILGKLSSGV